MKRNLLLFISILALSTACTVPDQATTITPAPQNTEVSPGKLSLADGFDILGETSLSNLNSVLEEEFFMLTGIKNESTGKKASIKLELDINLDQEEYSLEITKTIVIKGGSYSAVSMGLTSLLQLMDDELNVPKLLIKDQPDTPYRSLMIDLARGWHDMGVLKEIIILCKWYKINYLHLHLTDDQSFTFPSTAYPELATEGRSFTLEQLKDLNQYAIDRGVVLVPEIDVPGHSTQLVRKMPELFGIGTPKDNSYTISMGKEEVYDALNTLIQEIAEAFPHSPYIHIGGDEAFFTGMENDPATVSYMKEHNLPNLDELFRHFLVRMNNMVKASGKQTMVWAGFKEKGEIEIPRDMIVILWNHQYYDQQKLLDHGFQVVNASFKPLYVVNNRKWSADYIYAHWNPKRWESWATERDFEGVEVNDNNNLLIGATMCVWEQNQINQIHRLRDRLPAMAEKLWKSSSHSLAEFKERWKVSDKKLMRLLRPFEISTSGRTFPEMADGNFYEHLWFDKEIVLKAKTTMEGLMLRYTSDGSAVSLESDQLTDQLLFHETTTLKIQAFDQHNHAIGQPFHQRYFLKPIKSATHTLWKDLPPGSWEKLRFEEEMTVSLETSFDEYALHYTTDGSAPNTESPVYKAPISFSKTTQLRAQLIDKEGKPFGSGFSEVYYVIINEPSLTTGKPITATNDYINPEAAKKANNGRISLWEMWGGHVGEEVYLQVDLEQFEDVSSFKVYNFWDGYRYYQYTIDGSLDGETWTQLVDFSKNTEKASVEGYQHKIEPTQVRYLRINLLYNSANPGLHLVEFNAFK